MQNRFVKSQFVVFITRCDGCTEKYVYFVVVLSGVHIPQGEFIKDDVN